MSFFNSAKKQETRTDNHGYAALIKGLEDMKRQGVDSVLLSLYESAPSSDAAGRFISLGKDTNYYPFEMLPECEQKMILDGKHYIRVSLVDDNVGGLVRYPSGGVEIIQRTHVIPFLPEQKPESDFNYVTKSGLCSGKDLEEFAKNAEKSGWTKEIIEQVIASRINEYRAKTRELMEKSGVYKALEKMEQRKYTPHEQALFGK